MTDATCNDWSPGTYDRFRGLRLRPALDLLAQVPSLPAGDVVDLGCGSGAAGPVLRQRFPGNRLVGLDASPAMLAESKVGGAYVQLIQADIADWVPDSAPAMIFSNAVLHWLPDHQALLPALAAHLAPGGVLAVQMPGNFHAPSHALIRATAARLFPGRWADELFVAPVLDTAAYVQMLSPLGDIDGWETTYFQQLAPVRGGGHPVRAFTESTAMRPWLARMTVDERRAFADDYDAALDMAYPRQPDGAVLFPFRRMFLVLRR